MFSTKLPSTAIRFVLIKMNSIDLNRWHWSVIQTLIPTIVFISICCMTGAIGNTTVLIVYKTKKISGKGRFFIPILAFVDLLASLVCSFGVLLNLCRNVLFFSDVLCKIHFHIICWIFNASVFLVFAIAYDRYRIICQINRQPLSERQKWTIVWTILILSGILNIPVLVTSGTVFVPLPSKYNNSIKGSICTISKHLDPTFEVIHSFVVIIGIVSMFVCVLFFNVRIAYVICTKLRRSENNIIISYNKTKNKHFFTACMKCPFADRNSENDYLERDIPHQMESRPEDESIGQLEPIDISVSRLQVSKDKTCYPKYLLQTVRTHQSLYIHVMFFVMFVIMLLSYIPSLAIVLMIYKDHAQNFSVFDVEEHTMDINLFFSFQVSYLISSAANPYIYSLFDREFRAIVIGCIKL